MSLLGSWLSTVSGWLVNGLRFVGLVLDVLVIVLNVAVGWHCLGASCTVRMVLLRLFCIDTLLVVVLFLLMPNRLSIEALSDTIR